MEEVKCRDCKYARFYKENGVPFAERSCIDPPRVEQISTTIIFTRERSCKYFSRRK